MSKPPKISAWTIALAYSLSNIAQAIAEDMGFDSDRIFPAVPICFDDLLPKEFMKKELKGKSRP